MELGVRHSSAQRSSEMLLRSSGSTTRPSIRSEAATVCRYQAMGRTSRPSASAAVRCGWVRPELRHRRSRRWRTRRPSRPAASSPWPPGPRRRGRDLRAPCRWVGGEVEVACTERHFQCAVDVARRDVGGVAHRHLDRDADLGRPRPDHRGDQGQLGPIGERSRRQREALAVAGRHAVLLAPSRTRPAALGPARGRVPRVAGWGHARSRAPAGRAGSPPPRARRMPAAIPARSRMRSIAPRARGSWRSWRKGWPTSGLSATTRGIATDVTSTSGTEARRALPVGSRVKTRSASPPSAGGARAPVRPAALWRVRSTRTASPRWPSRRHLELQRRREALHRAGPGAQGGHRPPGLVEGRGRPNHRAVVRRERRQRPVQSGDRGLGDHFGGSVEAHALARREAAGPPVLRRLPGREPTRRPPAPRRRSPRTSRQRPCAEARGRGLCGVQVRDRPGCCDGEYPVPGRGRELGVRDGMAGARSSRGITGSEMQRSPSAYVILSPEHHA